MSPESFMLLLDYRVPRQRSSPYDYGEGIRDDVVARSTYARVVKPSYDAVIALVLLIALLPVICAVALTVRISLGRGVLLKQQRIGKGGRPFTMIKFRTMHPCRRQVAGTVVKQERRVMHKTEADPRHTRVGRFLRKWSLDELPELLNVIAGQMSIVGPRPELPHVVSRYEAWQHKRHLVKPGLTGLWQVTQRGEGLMHDFSHVDLAYVRHLSAGLDARIIAMTVPAILVRRGS